MKLFVSTRVELVHHRNTCNDVPWCQKDSGIEHATRFTIDIFVLRSCWTQSVVSLIVDIYLFHSDHRCQAQTVSEGVVQETKARIVSQCHRFPFR